MYMIKIVYEIVNGKILQPDWISIPLMSIIIGPHREILHLQWVSSLENRVSIGIKVSHSIVDIDAVSITRAIVSSLGE